MKRILLGVLLAAAVTVSAGEMRVKNNESIAFMGDSITQQGTYHRNGYVNLVMKALEHEGLTVKAYPAGISGHRSTHMNARLDKDVIAKKPTYMTFSCGVNDVWHGKNGVPLDQYKTLVTDIFDRCDKAGIKVIVLTATMIYETPENAHNKTLAAYNDFLRKIAKERNYPLADLNADMQKAIADIKAANPGIKGNLLTADGVHMNYEGNKMMAKGVLRAFGMSEDAISKAEKEVWNKIPIPRRININLSYDDIQKLKSKGSSLADVEKMLQKQIEQKLAE